MIYLDECGVLRSFNKTWILFLLVPYLLLAVIGELPHHQGHDNHNQSSSVYTFGYQSGSTLYIAEHSNDSEKCALCIAQSTLSACASFTLPYYSLPVIQTDETPGYRVLLSHYNPSLFSSRAPPSFLS